MKHVIVHVGEPRLLEAVQDVLQTRKDWTVDFAATSADPLQQAKGSSVILTDLPQAEESLSAKNGDGKDYLSPVVVLTTQRNERLAVQALREGAASYVPGRLVPTELASTLESVFAMTSARAERSRVMDCMTVWNTEFAIENDRHLVGPLVRYFQEASQRMGLFDHNEEMRLGIALEEAMINGMIHGNLEVSSALRGDDDEAFYRMIEDRRRKEPYASRRVSVRAECSRTQIRFIISDQGPGFDISKVPDPTDPANVDKVCGRGLLLMRTFMDEVVFNESGNRVELVKRSPNQS